MLRRYICNFCEKNFTLRFNFMEHFKVAHPSEPEPNIEKSIVYKRNTRSGIVLMYNYCELLLINTYPI